MHAMNGSRGFGIPRCLRITGCLAALVALAAMTVPSIAAANVKIKPVKNTYVALGDSLAFGYSQHALNENLPTGDSPTAFENGYASDYFNLINKGGRTQLINDGCPGETTESLIGDNPALLSTMNAESGYRVSEPITGEAPCAYHYEDGLGLHHEYGGSKSQLESVLETISVEQAAGTPVKMISLDIGANDELHTVAKAEKEAAARVETFVVNEVVGQALAETGGHEPEFRARIAELAGEYVENHGLELEQKGEAYALEIIQNDLPAEYEQIDTNVIGILNAIHDAGYHGKVIFEGTYDPYGRVEGVTKIAGVIQPGANNQTELEPGFNAAAAQLVSLEQATLTKKRAQVKLCYSNAEALFNPASVSETLANEQLEEERLAKWTNMGNFSVTTIPDEATLTAGSKEITAIVVPEFLSAGDKISGPGIPSGTKVVSVNNGAGTAMLSKAIEVSLTSGTYPIAIEKSNGPDIHATKEGYEQMAAQMHSTCSF